MRAGFTTLQPSFEELKRGDNMESPRERLLRENKETIEELQRWAEENPDSPGAWIFRKEEQKGVE